MRNSLIVMLFFWATIQVFSQWTANTTLNTPICTAANNQSELQMISDGLGGAIMVWTDERGTDKDIYAQRVNSLGVAQWGANGLAICTAIGVQDVPQLCSDGLGGAIIVWHDHRDPTEDIYAQHITSSGVATWGPNGMVICNAADDQRVPAIVSDGFGGAVIAWADYRTGLEVDIYARAINSSGVLQWTGDVQICNSSLAGGNAYSPQIVTDGVGGAIITFTSTRTYGIDNIFAQHINSGGSTTWTADGVQIRFLAGNVYDIGIISDGAGGAIITWMDGRGADPDIYIQRILSIGTVSWTADGVVVCNATNDQYSPTLTTDGANGAIVSWYDERAGGGNMNIYAQRINSSGSAQWTLNGVVICDDPQTQMYPQISSDDAGGAIITWHDSRNGVDLDIYAQRINSSGAALWLTNGAIISNALSNQYMPKIVVDGSNGAIIAWLDDRNATWDNFDIYAQGTSVLSLLIHIPTLPEWGLILLGTLFVGFGAYYLLRLKQ